MGAYAPVSDADLRRARGDPVFRQRLLEQNLEVLLASLKRLRQTAAPKDKLAAAQIREAVELAVRLAERIQGPTAARPRGRL